MGHNKLENQIREKLSSREIQPSAQAWDRLDAMLTVAEGKKPKRSLGWLYIAAGIAVLLGAGIFFFSQNTAEIQPQNDVVGTEVQNNLLEKENKSETPIPEKNQEIQVAVSNPQRDINSNQNQNSIINQKTNNQQTDNQSIANYENNQNQSSNQIIRDKEIQFQNSSDVALKDLPKIETKREIIVNNNKSQSDEQLLASLDKAVKQTGSQKSTVKVDAKSLLSQVDGEVEYTFREKVINKLSKNYKEVKVALSNRNSE